MVFEDRWRAGSPQPISPRARTVVWANQARVMQGRARKGEEGEVIEEEMDEGKVYVGIDVARNDIPVVYAAQWDINLC